MTAAAPRLRLFVPAPRGLGDLLAAELQALGASAVRAQSAGADCHTDLAGAYRICLGSRLASRVLLQLAVYEAEDEDGLYRGAREVDWPGVFDSAATFAIRSTLAGSPLRNSAFVGQRVKDAVVDAFRAASGTRPSVRRDHPDVQLHVYAQRRRITLALDLAGESLHRRGYRDAQAAAPLKENLAAGLLLLADWPAIAAAGGGFVDPMCGSGTLLVEAALMATDTAPGLLRDGAGCTAWHGHDADVFAAERAAAQARRRSAGNSIHGSDLDPAALRQAAQAAEQLGLAVSVQRCAIEAVRPPPGAVAGLLLCNPPYGERLSAARLPLLYSELGGALRRFPGWRAAVFSASAGLMHRLRLPVLRKVALHNGAIPCDLYDLGHMAQAPAGAGASPQPEAGADAGTGTDAAGTDFANRLRKNQRRLARWARRERVSCYRLYDADIPEYACALDYYGGAEPAAVLQEYRAPASIDPATAAARAELARQRSAEVLGLPLARVYLRTRQRQRGTEQYQALARQDTPEVIHEGGLRFQVNFTDYLDTGLFLDHRGTRARLRQLAAGKRFLNLFAYTGSATVYAAAGGASSTTSVDMSATYLDWARDNLALNDLLDPDRHRLVQADCLSWLADARRDGARFDLVFLDPPSFSNSKRMDGSFDVQRDHLRLLEAVRPVLAADGLLIFSSNRRRFRLDPGVAALFEVVDITEATRPPDYARARPPHHCFELRPRAMAEQSERRAPAPVWPGKRWPGDTG